MALCQSKCQPGESLSFLDTCSLKWYFTTKVCFVNQLLNLRCLELKIFYSFQCSSTIIACSFLKASKLSKSVHPKLSSASCDIIQVFFIVSHAQHFYPKLRWTPAGINIVPSKTAETPLFAPAIFVPRQVWDNFLVFFKKRTWTVAEREELCS